MEEVKKVYQNVNVEEVDIINGIVRIKNEYDFVNLDFLDLHWELVGDGKTIMDGKVEKLNIEPQSSILITIPIIPTSKHKRGGVFFEFLF